LDTDALKTSNGVALKEVTFRVAGRMVKAYSVSSRRTRQIWRSSDLAEAIKMFEAEVSRCPALSN
jgi:hypothetical protein